MLRRGKRYLVKDDEIKVKHDYVRFFTAEKQRKGDNAE